jgi:hypothetical protein
LIRPSDSLPFAANAPANTAASDPDFHSYLIMVTDTSTNGVATARYNMGSDGEWDAFEQGSNMFMIYSNGGGPFLYYLNTTLAHAKGCSPSTPCLTYSAIHGGAIGGGCSSSCTIINNQGRSAWSRVPGETYTFYELWSDGLTVYKDVINPSTDTFSRTLYANLGNAFPQTYYSTWNGVFSVATDGSIALAMAGGMDWQASTAYITNDYTSFIYPQSASNSAAHAFRATVGGTTSGTEPTWSSCTTTCTDGGVTWTNLGSISGQGPGFDAVVYLAGSASYRG